MRTSGVLCPISSLPSKYGIGCFSKEAYAFVDSLVWAGQSRWQVLPLGPTGFGDSPYQPFSTFAGNPYFVDLETLREEGLLTWEECEWADWGSDPRFVDYGKQYQSRYAVLRKAYERFSPGADYTEFCRSEKYWLDDYCLFRALKNEQGGALWTGWRDELRMRDPAALGEATIRLGDEIRFFMFIQYMFDRQWKKLKAYANARGVSIIGDLPIYVSLDSSDAWANPGLFQMDENGVPSRIAGCPPDTFSADGQRWGNPLYDWDAHRATGYKWWICRMRRSYDLYDIVRLDHFRGFAGYFSIPARDDTARFGVWEEGPGMELFGAIEEAMAAEGRPTNVIAEDLGALDEKVFDLLDATGYPGMKILQYAFDSGPKNFYLPHHYKRNCVVYTGTHDNDTTKAWYYGLPDWVREYTKAYLGNYDRPWDDIPWDFIRAAEGSTADTAIIPVWDLLCCGPEGRMNHPATTGGNWRWRMVGGELGEGVLGRLRWLTDTFGRLPEQQTK